MNPLAAQMLIEHVFKNRIPRAADKYKLCIVNGELECIASYSPIKTDMVLGIFSELQIANGFNSKEWAELACKVCKYIEKEASCLNDLKP